MTKVLILDTETTGASSVDQPIEFAASLFELSSDGSFIRKLDSYSGKREPSVPISFMAQQVHKIRMADLVGKDFDHKKIKSLITEADFLIAHNADFDARMLEGLYPDIKSKAWRCTLYQWPWPYAAGKSLSSIALELGASHTNAHSAEGDVDVLADCLFHQSGNGSFIKNLLQSGDYVFKKSNLSSFKRAAINVSTGLNQACEGLMDIIGAVISDETLHDSEIKFMSGWIEEHSTVTSEWPGNVIAQQLKQILEDGFISEDERKFLLNSLSEISTDALKRVSEAAEKSDFQPDDVDTIEFSSHTFCLSGDFIFGDKDKCANEITKRGGVVLASVTKKLNYLIVGGLGSDQWKHGNFGTKIERAIQYRSDGIPIKIVHEEAWAKFL